ncbi:hypothetical protein MMC09_006579 [Bachmanniomyces sp. S44760]|nr:hypothetical protein [Bachmanniomyces sp. S44760]
MRVLEDPTSGDFGTIDWTALGRACRELLLRLEDPKIDGTDLGPGFDDGGDLYIQGAGRTGHNVSSKSEPWRRGYHYCLMSAARVAENREGWVRDISRDILFPPGAVIGPSNPRPSPMPYGAPAAPLEENCEPAFELPQSYYMKILTTQGFDSHQRIEAALACADWFDFKGLASDAENMNDLALEIAVSALPLSVHEVVHTRTGVINEGCDCITPNILLATTSLATHHARNGNLSAALPIFLSILRAQRKLRPSTFMVPEDGPKEKRENVSMFSSLRSFFDVLKESEYPALSTSGDQPATRTAKMICEESAIMTHIGEVLFASSATTSRSFSPFQSSNHSFLSFLNTDNRTFSARELGLSWTRSAVSQAEETLLSLSSSASSNTVTSREDEIQTRASCTECLHASMENWQKMVSKLQEAENLERMKYQDSQYKRSGWFWGPLSPIRRSLAEERWKQEEKLVQERAEEIKKLIRIEGYARPGQSGWILFQ